MDKDPAQLLLRGKKAVDDDSGSGPAPVVPMAPHLPGHQHSLGTPIPGERAGTPGAPGDAPHVAEPFETLVHPSPAEHGYDGSAPATPPGAPDAPLAEFVRSGFAPVVAREPTGAIVTDMPVSRGTVPSSCACCGGPHHEDGTPAQVMALADPGTPLDAVPVLDGVAPLQDLAPFRQAVPLQQASAQGVPAGPPGDGVGGDTLWHKVEWPRDGDTDPSGPLRPGEVLLREVKGPDPDGAGPLDPHVSYEAVRVLPDGAQGGEPLKAGDHLMREVSGPDPDGAGPGMAVNGVHAMEVVPGGWEGQRVEPIPLGEAPPHLRDLALAVDPNGDRPAPRMAGRLEQAPLAPGARGDEGEKFELVPRLPETDKGGEPGSSTPATPRNVTAVLTPGPGGGHQGKDQEKDEGKDGGKSEGKGGKDEGEGEGKDGGKSEGKDGGKSEGKGEGGDAGGGRQSGNVSPDPNLTFDEGAYNQLLGVIHSVKIALQQDAARTGGMTIDAEWEIKPMQSNGWQAGRDLHGWGLNFGDSVEGENRSLRNELDRFETRLVSIRDVFKDTEDLAAYNATVFASEYPGFGGGPSV